MTFVDPNLTNRGGLFHGEQHKCSVEVRSVEHDPPCLIFTSKPLITNVRGDWCRNISCLDKIKMTHGFLLWTENDSFSCSVVCQSQP